MARSPVRESAPGPGAQHTFLSNLQIARLLAAALVMFGHAQFEARDNLGAGDVWLARVEPIYWPAGVDIFFVISGFIMYFLTHDRFGSADSAQQFLKRRLIRVVPLYWAFLALMVVTVLALGERINNTDISPIRILASYAFIPWPREDGNVVPVLSSGWTLNYEMLFYVCFGLCLLLPRRAGLAVLVGGFLAAAAVHYTVPESWFVLVFWTDPIIINFLFGIGLASVYLRGLRLPPAAALAVGVLGLGGLVVSKTEGWHLVAPHPVSLGASAALICAAFVLAKPPQRGGRVYGLGVLAGDASYSLYLSHPFTINALLILWQAMGLNAPVVFLVVAMVCCVATSVAIYLYVERPALAYISRMIGTRPPLIATVSTTDPADPD